MSKSARDAAMVAIHDAGGLLPVKQLRALLARDGHPSGSAFVSRVGALCEAEGLITICFSESDRRRKIFAITDKGCEYVDSASQYQSEDK